MSLATRCTSCGTVFRVVQDQLKVSEGWVRCGRCESVFNALEGLLDLEREVPTGWDEAAVHDAPSGVGPGAGFEPESASRGPPAGSAPQSSTGTVETTPSARAEAPSVPAAVATGTTGSSAAAAPPAAAKPSGSAPAAPPHVAGGAGTWRDEHRGDEGAPSIRDELLADPIDAHLFGPRKRTESAPKPAGQLGARDRLDFSDARFDSDLFADATALDEPEASIPSTVAAELPLESSARPEFVRRADQHARWRSRPLRGMLMLIAGVAASVLALQVGHHFRDSLAGDWPALRPALAAWCGLAACGLEAPRRIDAVTVESTGLARAVGFDAYVLSVGLRNRSTQVVALPAVDLRLTDGNGRLVSRRVLTARDFRAPAQLPAGAELALQLTLATGRTPVSGYTVEIFYP